MASPQQISQEPDKQNLPKGVQGAQVNKMPISQPEPSKFQKEPKISQEEEKRQQKPLPNPITSSYNPNQQNQKLVGSQENEGKVQSQTLVKPSKNDQPIFKIKDTSKSAIPGKASDEQNQAVQPQNFVKKKSFEETQKSAKTVKLPSNNEIESQDDLSAPKKPIEIKGKEEEIKGGKELDNESIQPVETIKIPAKQYKPQISKSVQPNSSKERVEENKIGGPNSQSFVHESNAFQKDQSENISGDGKFNKDSKNLKPSSDLDKSGEKNIPLAVPAIPEEKDESESAQFHSANSKAYLSMKEKSGNSKIMRPPPSASNNAVSNVSPFRDTIEIKTKFSGENFIQDEDTKVIVLDQEKDELNFVQDQNYSNFGKQFLKPHEKTVSFKPEKVDEGEKNIHLPPRSPIPKESPPEKIEDLQGKGGEEHKEVNSAEQAAILHQFLNNKPIEAQTIVPEDEKDAIEMNLLFLNYPLPNGTYDLLKIMVNRNEYFDFIKEIAAIQLKVPKSSIHIYSKGIELPDDVAISIGYSNNEVIYCMIQSQPDTQEKVRVEAHPYLPKIITK